jgi:hypothetical protein
MTGREVELLSGKTEQVIRKNTEVK